MQFSKVAPAALLGACALFAQKPAGITRFIDPWLDYWVLRTNISGDNEMATAWAANSMLPLFPDPGGLPVLAVTNDGNAAACSGNISIFQISKLAGIGVGATTSNTLLTPFANCMSSYGSSSTEPSNTWLGRLSAGDTGTVGTWKGVVMAFRNGRLLAPFYRQDNAGTAFGDSTMTMSPDAGQTWIDYGRWQAYTVTSAACAGNTVTLTAANALSAGKKIIVHDVGAGYDGKQTLTNATTSTVQYVSMCPGTSPTSGYFGVLDASGSEPIGPCQANDCGTANPSYGMMWPGINNNMAVQMIISYGQDGNYPSGIEAACDPRVYVCGLAHNPAGNGGIVLYRFPVDHEMDKSLYQWYMCSGYSSYFPVADTACDGNNPANWTSAQGNATVLLYAYLQGNRPAQVFMMKYLASHNSYLTANISRTPTGNRLSFYWAPHAWGPFYPVTNSDCSERDSNYPYGCVPFFSLMDYGENVISSTPPLTQIRISAKNDHDSGNNAGSPGFWTVEAGGGRVPFVGAARRAEYMGTTSQLGVGHRFVTGNEAGAISRRGKGTSGSYWLDWWVDFWDHGGATSNGATNRSWFRDLITGGSRYFMLSWDDGFTGHTWTHSANLAAVGPYLGGAGYNTRFTSNFNDTVLSAGGGNNDWTYVGVFNITNPNCAVSGCPAGGVQNEFGRDIPVGLILNTSTSKVQIVAGAGAGHSGNLCALFFSGTVSYCTADGVVTTNTWYFLAVSAKANPSGTPTLTFYLGTAGTITEYGGVNMATSPNGTSGGGVTKACASGCNTTPATPSASINLGQDWEGIQGYLGEAGLYAGTLPSHVIREIYRTLRTDWARVGRGAI
jgi:hypothetical protein